MKLNTKNTKANLEIFSEIPQYLAADNADIIAAPSDSRGSEKSAFASLGVLSLIDYIITGEGIEINKKRVFEENKIELIISEL